MIISTFQVQDRDVQQAVILGQQSAGGWGSLPDNSTVVGATATTSASGEFGTSLKSFHNALKLGVA